MNLLVEWTTQLTQITAALKRELFREPVVTLLELQPGELEQRKAEAAEPCR